MAGLDRLTVRGYKSIRALEDFELRNLNVLIGANGAGKSNFISLFQMMAAMMDGRLQFYIQTHDGPDALLHGTRRRTPQIEAKFRFGLNGYYFILNPTGRRMVFEYEEIAFYPRSSDWTAPLGIGHDEAQLSDNTKLAEHTHRVASHVRSAIKSWRVYHFSDTSISAAMRQAKAVRDNIRLHEDAGNIAPFLRMLREKHRDEYERIIDTIRTVAPFFGDFLYREDPGEQVELEWLERGDPDTVYGPRQFSDGTLRFICLATLLLQPHQFQPDTILIDEPELGLHPYALGILAALLRRASEQVQVIVSTQSADLVSELSPEDVVVVGREGGASTFTRLDSAALTEWLKDYSLGELWKMNVVGGRPAR